MSRSSALRAVVVLAMTAAAFSVAAPAFASTTIDVHPGQSIQRAVDRAHPGDTVLVHAGVYHQTVLIRKDFITLKGEGPSRTVLAGPPNNNSLCTRLSGGAGVCVIAKSFRPFTPVVGDRVTGFKFRDFRAFGVVTFGSRDAVVDHNIAGNNGEYGITSFRSMRSRFFDNVSYGSGEAGFYFGDEQNGDATITNNVSYGNFLGLLLRDSSEGNVSQNNFHDNCGGILVLAGAPGPAKSWSITNNWITHNTKACPPGDETPPLSGLGIALEGTVGVTVAHNHVLGNRPAGASAVSGGIVVQKSFANGSYVPRDNVVYGNTAFHNRRYDVWYDRTGAHNRFLSNNCGRSRPASICS